MSENIKETVSVTPETKNQAQKKKDIKEILPKNEIVDLKELTAVSKQLKTNKEYIPVPKAFILEIENPIVLAFCADKLEQLLNNADNVQECNLNNNIYRNKIVSAKTKNDAANDISGIINKCQIRLKKLHDRLDECARQAKCNKILSSLTRPDKYKIRIETTFPSQRDILNIVMTADTAITKAEDLYSLGAFGSDLLKSNDQYKNQFNEAVSLLKELTKIAKRHAISVNQNRHESYLISYEKTKQRLLQKQLKAEKNKAAIEARIERMRKAKNKQAEGTSQEQAETATEETQKEKAEPVPAKVSEHKDTQETKEQPEDKPIREESVEDKSEDLSETNQPQEKTA